MQKLRGTGLYGYRNQWSFSESVGLYLLGVCAISGRWVRVPAAPWCQLLRANATRPSWLQACDPGLLEKDSAMRDDIHLMEISTKVTFRRTCLRFACSFLLMHDIGYTLLHVILFLDINVNVK